METVTSADGTPIAFERTGSGPPLVLVHGTTADHTRWEPVRPALEQHLTVYAVDRRGRGGSGDADAYAIEREFEDVVAVVDSIDEPVHLLGHSFGAICALEAALRTDNLRTLLLYEPPITIDDNRPDHTDALTEMRALYDDGEGEQALLTFFRDVVRAPPKELDALRAAPNWQARVEAVHTILREEPAAADYVFDPARFADMITPTLLLVGSETSPLFQEATDVLYEALSNSRIVVMDGQAHVAITTAPDLFVEEVRAFLGEHASE